MNLNTLNSAIAEAERFLVKAKELQNKEGEKLNRGYLTGNALTGSVRRASMDLTRALAEMRKSQ
jgi:hypothetical protein